MRPLRHYLPDRVYLITARCFEERFFLSPDTAEVSLIVASTLAMTVEKYRLELFAYVVMSNHIHLIVRAPEGGLPEAMQMFFSQVARRINVLRNRRGPVFSDRYHHQTICDEGALHTAIRYVLHNPLRAGLCESARSWAGLSSYTDTCESQVILCTRRMRGAEVVWSMRRVPSNAPEAHGYDYEEKGDGIREERFVLRCHPASLLQGGDANPAHNAFVASLLADEHKAAELPSSVRLLAPANERPPKPKRSRAPSCIASTSTARSQYVAERRSFVAAYRLASARFRTGQDATFPPGCCLPWPRLHSLLSSSDTYPVRAPITGSPGAATVPT